MTDEIGKIKAGIALLPWLQDQYARQYYEDDFTYLTKAKAETIIAALESAKELIDKPGVGDGWKMPKWNELERPIQRAIENKADITASYAVDLYGFIRETLAPPSREPKWAMTASMLIRFSPTNQGIDE